MVVKSEKVTLRPFCSSDGELLLQWRFDKEIRFLMMMHPYPISESLNIKWLDGIMNDTSNKKIYFAIEENISQKLIGYFTLQNIDLINRNAMLGIIIGDKNYRGKGLGKDIMKAGMEYGFNSLGLNKISLLVVQSNEQAIRLYESVGFQKEGTLIRHYFFDGIWHNALIMAKFIP